MQIRQALGVIALGGVSLLGCSNQERLEDNKLETASTTSGEIATTTVETRQQVTQTVAGKNINYYPAKARSKELCSILVNGSVRPKITIEEENNSFELPTLDRRTGEFTEQRRVDLIGQSSYKTADGNEVRITCVAQEFPELDSRTNHDNDQPIKDKIWLNSSYDFSFGYIKINQLEIDIASSKGKHWLYRDGNLAHYRNDMTGKEIDGVVDYRTTGQGPSIRIIPEERSQNLWLPSNNFIPLERVPAYEQEVQRIGAIQKQFSAVVAEAVREVCCTR